MHLTAPNLVLEANYFYDITKNFTVTQVKPTGKAFSYENKECSVKSCSDRLTEEDHIFKNGKIIW